MKKLLVCIGLLLFLARPAFAQQSASLSGTTCPGAACLNLDIVGGAVGVQVTGTFVGTLQFEQSIDLTNFATWSVTATGSSTTVTSATATGLWVGNVSGARQVRVRFSAYTSGTAVVTMQQGAASVRALFPDLLPSTLKVDPGTGTPLTFNDNNYSLRAGLWARIIGTTSGQSMTAAAHYAAASTDGASVVRGAVNLAAVPTTTTGTVAAVRGAVNEAACKGQATMTNCLGALNWAFANGTGNTTHVYGSQNWAFLQGTGNVTDLVGSYAVAEKDPVGSGTVTNVIGFWASRLDSTGNQWGAADLYDFYAGSGSGTGTTTGHTYGLYCEARQTATGGKWCVYGLDPIQTEAGIWSKSTTGGVGYVAGSGCAVTQASSKSTGVICTGMSGAITMNNASLNATTSVGFTVTDTSIVATDVVILSIKSGATADSYTAMVDAVGAGSFRVSLRNYTGGSLGEAVVINFAILRAVAS